MLTDKQAQSYLDRIGFTDDVRPDKKTLDALVLSHQMSVPFETVVLHRTGALPSLELDDLYEKVVARNGGGYCFELNKGFEALLKTLGFDARPVISRAVRGREERMPINHRGCIVALDDGLYSVDVGFGGPMPSGALLLEEGEDQVINGEIYAAKRGDDAWWKIERLTRAGMDSYDDDVPARRQVELELCTAAVEEQDFDSLNAFFARPGTLFHDHALANLRTPQGYLALKDDVLTVRENGEKEVIRLDGKGAMDEVLADRFNMTHV